jgi:hypothetical protein
MSTTVTSKSNRWKQHGGYTTGALLALAGLVLAAVTVANSALRAANGHVAVEPWLTVGLRVAGGVGLVVAGFVLMVLSIRGVDAEEVVVTDHRIHLEAAVAGHDLLCGRCGAANDHLARFCDQCGRKL